MGELLHHSYLVIVGCMYFIFAATVSVIVCACFSDLKKVHFRDTEVQQETQIIKDEVMDLLVV